MRNFSVLANLSKFETAYTCEIHIFLGVFLREIFYSFEPQCDIQKKHPCIMWIKLPNCQLQQMFMQNNSECVPNVRMNLFCACLSG